MFTYYKDKGLIRKIAEEGYIVCRLEETFPRQQDYGYLLDEYQLYRMDEV